MLQRHRALSSDEQKLLRDLKRYRRIIRYPGGVWAAPGTDRARIQSQLLNRRYNSPNATYRARIVESLVVKGYAVISRTAIRHGRQMAAEIRLAPGAA